MDQSQFDQLLDLLGPLVAEITADFAALQARLSTVPSQDFAAESAKLQSSLDALTALHASVSAPAPAPADASADAPAPAPADQPPA